MNKGDFIKWTSTDEDGTFSHVGKIVKTDDAWIDFLTPTGLMSVRRADGTFEPADPITLKSEVRAEAKKQVAKAKAAPKTGTKLSQAVALFKAMTNPSRQELITKFVGELGMTPAGASTYAAMVRKHA